MLGKLIKYEFKATARTFVPIYIAILLVALLNRVFRIGKINIAFGISAAVLTGLFMALGVLTIIMIIQRFKKNLLGDEGYLMFTLPTNSTRLITSKIIISIVWVIVSTVVAFLGFLILLGDAKAFSEIFTNWNYIWLGFETMTQREFSMNGVSFIFSMLGMGVLGYITFILQVYLSLATAQLPVFGKHRGIIGFVAFFAINVIMSIVTEIIDSILPATYTTSATYCQISVTGIIYMLVICAVLFIGTKTILDKHLNLE